MDWATDLEITSKKLIPRLGRRAGLSKDSQDDRKSDEDLLESPLSSGKSINHPPAVPPRTRKTGWGDDLKSGKIKSAASGVIEQERLRSMDKDDFENDIPVIPDLDEIHDDHFTNNEIANASALNMDRVTAYKELDTDLIKNAAFTSVDGVNLELLAEKLYPEQLIHEPDEVWNWNVLFTQITSEINNEIQKKSDS